MVGLPFDVKHLRFIHVHHPWKCESPAQERSKTYSGKAIHVNGVIGHCSVDPLSLLFKGRWSANFIAMDW
eukprot:CAMPEP_0194739074 /NCGR_PEP_ID=MMETSP0296-20130528/87294_1 /TAXON_ID=39354 /ORGANISM="Heterosigma akashiwo, Strain CCMP2393" /LENGTH=69 /DNA_ID=CAMNT_0039649697 /DNA_START=96 /DNA_END=302 /DNA_ORIENTATION=-